MSWENCMKQCLPQGEPRITSRFGMRKIKEYNYVAKMHGGVDFAYPGGRPKNHAQPVYSPVAGEVTVSTTKYGAVYIKDAKGYSHQFLHMTKHFVKKGESVSVGQKIGLMGGIDQNGKYTFAPHVHYQLQKPTRNRTFMNPVDFWNGVNQLYVTPDPSSEDDEDVPHGADPNHGGYNGEPGGPSGNVNDYMPKQAGVGWQSAAELALWTNRVPQHEPWCRTLMVNTKNLNEPTDEHEFNTRHNPQFTDDTEAGSKGIGRIEGSDVIERGPFWRR